MLQEWFEKIVAAVEMDVMDENPFGCGTYLKGFGRKVTGSAWHYQYRKILSVTKCDFVFTRDVHLKLEAKAQYLGFRLEYAHHLPPGKVIAFVEDDCISLDTMIRKGTHFAYTEVDYAPTLYNKYFTSAFETPPANPVEIIKSMGDNHSWSSKITQILIDISRNALSGPAAELFYIGKSCELMSALIEMGIQRLPGKVTDYEEIQRVLHYIDLHFRDDIKQSDLTRVANMSPTKLKNLFHQFTGCSITDYISDKKADYAVKLLSETDLPVEEIAKSLGFQSLSGFSTSFKKRIGISPSAYRKQLQFQCVDNASYLAFIGQED